MKQYTTFVDGECKVLQSLENRDRYIIFQKTLLQIQQVLDLEASLSLQKDHTSYELSQDADTMLQTAAELKKQVQSIENLICFADLKKKGLKK